jgi:hypothetical protein
LTVNDVLEIDMCKEECGGDGRMVPMPE